VDRLPYGLLRVMNRDCYLPVHTYYGENKMGTIVHTYDPRQNVYVITTCDKKEYVNKGTVIRVRTSSLISGVEIVYDIRILGDSGTGEYAETDVFVDKTTAIAEYDTRVA